MKIKSLKARVLIWFGSILAIVLILFSFSFRYFLNQSINENIKTKLHSSAVDILSDFKESKRSDFSKEKNRYIAIYKDDKMLYKSPNFPNIKLIKYLKSSQNFYSFEDKKNDETIDAIYTLKDKNYTLIIFKKQIDNKIENFTDTMLVLEPLLFLLLLFLASKLIDKTLQPIKELTKTANYISINNFQETIDVPKNSDEIKELILAFNKMINRLKEGIDNLERFNADVSHELKTPLTIIKGESELALKKSRSQEEYIKSLKAINYETKQLENIVSNLLFLSKYTKDNIKQTFRECYLDSLILNILTKQEKKIKDKNLNIQIEKLEHITLNSNQLLLQTIFSNIIDNAIKYTPNNKTITIGLYKNSNIHFIVEDEGIGIEKEHLSKITKRFYRVDNSRNKKIEGFGLGLSLVQKSIELLEAKMEISSIKSKGTKICIIL